MSARSVIEHALTAYYAESGQADQVVRVLLHNYDHAHRNQVLAEDGQEYNGQLAMLTGLVATLHATVEHGDLPEVKKLLAEHKRDEQGARKADAITDFFRPGRTYAEPDGSTDWRFRCDSITTHPEDGERTALGWRHFRGDWEPYAYGEDDWEIHQAVNHIDATEAGEAR